MNRSSTSKRLVQSSTFVGISTLLYGGLSALVMAVGARRLNAVSMADFVGNWVAVNVTLIAISAAFDQIGPRIVANQRASEGVFVARATFLPMLAASIVGVFVGWGSPEVWDFISMFVYVIFASCWFGERSLAIACGHFSNLAVATVPLIVVAGCLVAALPPSTPGSLFFVAASGHLASFIVLRRSRQSTSFPTSARFSTDEYRTIASLVFSSVAVLAISSGGVVMAASWGVSATNIVVYAAILNIVRVPFIALTSLLGPANIEITCRIGSDDVSAARRFTLKLLVGVLGVGVVTVFAIVAIGQRLLAWFIGSGYSFGMPLAIAIVVVESCLLSWGLVRMMAVALNRSSSITHHSTIGLLVFVAVGILPAIGSHRLIWAPLLGALTTFFLALGWLVFLPWDSKRRV